MVPVETPRGVFSKPMRAEELLTQPVVTVRGETSVAEIAKAMVDNRVGCVLVVDHRGKLRGIVTQTNFGGDEHGVPFSMELLLQMFSRSMSTGEIEKARQEAWASTAEEIMVTDVITAAEDTPVEEIARKMLRLRHRPHPGRAWRSAGWDGGAARFPADGCRGDNQQ